MSEASSDGQTKYQKNDEKSPILIALIMYTLIMYTRPNHLYFFHVFSISFIMICRNKHTFIKSNRKKRHSIVIVSLWALFTVCGIVEFRNVGTKVGEGIISGASRAVQSMYDCKTSGDSLSQSSWRDVHAPIILQSPQFVADAYVTTGKNFSIVCYNSMSAVSNEQRQIYAPVTDAFMPAPGLDTCHSFHVFTMQDACECLRPSRVILGFGDSLTRRIMESWMTASPKVNQFSKETRVPHNVTVLENSSLLPCEHVGSLTQVYKLTAWLFPHLQTKVLPTLDDLHAGGQSVDLLLIGFGIHTVLDTKNIDWEYWISETVLRLTRHPATKHARVYWMLPHQLYPSKFPAPRNVTDRDRNLDVRRFNNLVVDLVRHANWTVLDFYHLTENKGQQTSDGIHFEPEVYRWKNQHVLNHLCPRSFERELLNR